MEFPETSREKELRLFSSDLKQLIFQFKEFLKATRLKEKETFQDYFKQKFKLEKEIMEMFDFIEANFQKLIQKKQMEFDQINEKQ